MAALLIFLVFLGAVALSVPIGAAMILGSAAPVLLLEQGGSLAQIIHNAFSGANATPILAVPLFILGGVIMAEGGISRRLFDLFAYFVGRFPGGIPCAAILTCLFYGAISGSGPATAAAVGAMCIPFMVELGYDRAWSAGLVSVAGGLGVIIPPSIPFVLYSLATGVSTGDLFLAGVLPGVLVAVVLMVCAVAHCLRQGEDRGRIDRELAALRARGFGTLFRDSFWALLCPVIILGGIYSGFFTPTEAACVSVFYALFVALFLYRTITVKDILPMLRAAVKNYAGLAFVLAFATAFGRVLSMTRATTAVEDFFLAHFHSAPALLAVLVVLFLLLGMVMDTGPAIIILAPVLLPVAERMGVHPVHFGVILVCCLSIGLATPPFGLNMFVAGNLAEESPVKVARASAGFIAAFLVALCAVTAVQPISTALLGEKEGDISAETVVGSVSNETQRHPEQYAHLEKVTLVGADSSSKGAVGQRFGELVSEKVSDITGGRLTIDYHPNGELGGDTDLLRQSQSGDLDIVVCQTAPIVSFVPEMAVFDLPMVFARYDRQTIEAVLNGENSPFRQELGRAYEKAGFHLLGILHGATYRLTTADRPLNTLADFASLQIRTMENANHMAFWKAIGAEPTPLPWGEVYFALASGSIDAQENAADTCVGANFHEVQRYLACTNHILYANQISVSERSWEKLPELYRQALEQAVEETMAELSVQLADIDAVNKDKLILGGMTLVEYEDTFYEEILALPGVRQLYDRIDADVGGLASLLRQELAKENR